MEIGLGRTGGALRDRRLIAENRFAVGRLALSSVTRPFQVGDPPGPVRSKEHVYSQSRKDLRRAADGGTISPGGAYLFVRIQV